MPVQEKSGVRYQGLTARDLALIAVFAALIAALSVSVAIPIPFSPVPVTLQTLGVMLVPALIGWKRGTLAVVVLIALGLAGLPLFAGGRGGLAVLAGPSGGMVVGWVFGALVIGVLTELVLRSGRYRFWRGTAVNVLGGMLVIYAVGVPWMAVVLGDGALATLMAVAVYLPGDLAKAVVTALIAATVHRAYPIPPAGRPVTPSTEEGRA